MYELFIHLLLSVAALVPDVTGQPVLPHQCKRSEGAVYLLTNTQSNSVVALSIGNNGTLSEGSSTSTGGIGSNAISSSTNQSSAPDALFAQSPLTVAHNFIFAVNAGSNTVSMLKINKDDPTKLAMVGEPVSIPGEFPNTVDASWTHKIVCVGASGSKAGVSCAPFSVSGIGSMDALRPFELNQSTPPVGPLNTVSQVFFSEDETTLFTTVKGDPGNNNTGFLAAFPVQLACGTAAASVSQQGMQSSPAGTAVLFGAANIPGSTDLFVSDASFGGAILSIDPISNNATVKGKAVVDGQQATCWAAVSLKTNTGFVTDVGVNRIVEMSLDNASIQKIIDLSSNGDPGLIDLQVVGDFIYALSPGNGTTASAVTVVDVISRMQVQHFQVQNDTFDKNAVGMAVFLTV